ncbi:hypothetical protein P3T76_004870 [Phytophthora citrophthora]|uniref:DUF7769 domain-containing protein n=1 Tax=Phytophthora citrophthora TaxID=4793 RepID=A0AAD9GRY6_9STRA|nr:hypothetical protein P3T76_004870 [Phytophthora citrophthora]
MQEGVAFASLPTEVAREVNDLIQNKNVTETIHGKAPARSKPNMTDTERLNMADFLLQHSQGEARLPRAVISAAADKFQVHRNTVSRIWNQMKTAMDAGASADVVMKQALSKKRGNCGRKKKDYSAALEKVKQLPLNQRGSLRALSTAVGVPRTTLFRLLKDDTDSNPTDTADCEHQETTSNEPKTTIANAIKPALSDKNKRDRLRFCFSKMQPNGVFDDMYNVVHINTKWCLLPSSRNTKKTKVMFLVAVARPHWDNERQQQFDGKLGVWPFVEADPEVSVLPWDQAASHAGRAIRALETITKKEIQTMVTNYVIPAIKMKMPRAQHNRPLFIQIDNPQVRLTADDHLVAEHGRADGWDIRVQHQPAYSPELVVLTHNFMKTIYPEVMQVRNATMQLTPIEELIATVEHSFAALPKGQINDAFLALQKTMECIMLAEGSNDFDSKEDATKKSLQHDGSLPVSVLCSREALSACQSALNLPQE